jgi:hypothetical protein
MTGLPEPSAWFSDRFGEHSQGVMLALAKAGRAAHERSLDAKTGSQLASNEAYGSFWVILPEEVAAHLGIPAGREVIRPTAADTTWWSSMALLSFLPSADVDRRVLTESNWAARISVAESSRSKTS